MCYKVETYAKLATRLRDKMQGMPEFIVNFINSYKSTATRNNNWCILKGFLEWLLDRKYMVCKDIFSITVSDFATITVSNLDQYFEYLQGSKNNTLETICTKKKVLNAFWNYLLENGNVEKNVVKFVSKSKYKTEKKRGEVKVQTDKEQQAFLNRLATGNNNEFDIERNIAIVKLLAGSGIRCQELINLDVSDVFLNGGELLNEGGETKSPFINILGKGNIQEYESVFISSEAAEALNKYLIVRTKFLLDKHSESEALFLSNRGVRLKKTAITSFFKRYSNGEITPHMMRHYVGTKLYESTGDLILVQKQLRHSSRETTAKYYVKTNKNNLISAVGNLSVYSN